MTLCPARDFRYKGMNSCNEFPINTFHFHGIYIYTTLYNVASQKNVFLMHIIN